MNKYHIISYQVEGVAANFKTIKRWICCLLG